MKNIHILPTGKPSRLILQGSELLLSKYMEVNEGFSEFNQHLFITSDEEIKEGDKDFYIIANDRDKTWINRLEKVVECKIDPKHGKVLILSSGTFLWIDEGKKIILTTDQDLINDGVQAIDDEFLEWFVKNPSCEEVEIGEGVRYEDEWIDNEDGGEIFQHQYCSYKIIIPKEENSIEAKQRAKNYMSLKGALEPKQIKCYCGHTTYCDCSPLEEPKQETVEEAAEKYAKPFDNRFWVVATFKEGAKWEQEQDKNKYSEEDMKEAFNNGRDMLSWSDVGVEMKYNTFNDWFEQFNKKK